MTTLSLFRRHEKADVDEELVLDAYVEAIEVTAGSTIVRQGEFADAFYVILAGEFTVFLESDPRSIPIGTLGPGCCFGETGLLETGTRTATVRATTDGELAVLGLSELRHIMTDAVVCGIDLATAAYTFTTRLDWHAATA
jgi:cAMP-dependent protein kinase regulator